VKYPSKPKRRNRNRNNYEEIVNSEGEIISGSGISWDG
jgi:hypothetical protein